MKRQILIILIFVFSTMAGIAQQIPVGNLYNSNEYLINSAESAVDTIPVIFLSHRQQWLSVSGLPITNMINGHTHVSENSAIGFKLFNDKFGLINQYFGMASFAHRFRFSPKSCIAFGASVGYYKNSIKFDRAVIEDGSDVLLQNGNYTGSTFETSASAMLEIDHFKLGISVPRLIEQNANSKNNLSDFVLKRHLRFYSRFHYDINSNLYLEPSALVKLYPETGQSQFEGNVDLYINKDYAIGAGFRQQEAIMLRGMVKPHKYLSIAYSYEFFTSGFTQFSNGSHEIRVGIYFNRKKKQEKPPLKPVEPRPRYQFQELPSEDAIVLHLSESDPGLTESLKVLADRDDFTIRTVGDDKSYEIEIKSDKDHLETRKFKLKTLQELRDFVYGIKDSDPTLQGDLEKIIDNSDIIKFEMTYQYETLASEDDILIKIQNKDPLLSEKLKVITDRDDVELKYAKEGFALDVGDDSNKKRYVFKTLEEMNEFMLHLESKNPGMSDNLLEMINDDDKLRGFEDETFKFQKLNKNEDILLDIGNRTPGLSADLRKLTDLHDDIEVVREEDRSYSIVIGEDLEKRKFKFKTLGQLNQFMRKLKFKDPTLKSDPITAIDKDPYLKIYEDNKFVFKRLKESNELLLKIAPENPGLSDNLKKLMDDRTDMIVSVDKYGRYEVELTDEVTKEKKFFKFETLDELNSFSLKLRSANPTAEDNLKQITDNMGLQYEDASYSQEELETLRGVVRFEIGTSKLTSYSERLMKEKIAIVKEKPFKKLIIAGYTCDIGSDQLNRKLSKQRAQKIANFFIKEGIPADKLEVHGKGPDYPMVPNTTDANRRKNRRVEFEIYF